MHETSEKILDLDCQNADNLEEAVDKVDSILENPTVVNETENQAETQNDTQMESSPAIPPIPPQLLAPDIDNDTNDELDFQNTPFSNDANLFFDVENLLSKSPEMITSAASPVDVENFLQTQFEDLEQSDVVSLESSKSDVKRFDVVVSFRKSMQKFTPQNIVAKKTVENLINSVLRSHQFMEKIRQRKDLKLIQSVTSIDNEDSLFNVTISTASKDETSSQLITEQNSKLDDIVEIALPTIDEIEVVDENAYFQCIEQLPLDQQKTCYNLFALLLRESFLNVLENSIPCITKEMEHEFSVLSSIFDDMNNFHHKHICV